MNFFLCPGQGSQSPGMGREIYEKSDAARRVFDKGSELTGIDLRALCCEADGEVLDRTENAQLALFTVAAAGAEALRDKGIEAQGVAGFSFGECSALYIAGVLDLADAFALVRHRASLMQEVSDAGGGAMCAVLGLDAEAIVALAQDSGAAAVNFNCPGQTVISGSAEAVERLSALCKGQGAKRCVPLNVSGAFHTEAMRPAALRLAQAVAGLRFSSLRIPLYSNVNAQPLPADMNLGEHLASQMCSPVLWQRSMERCHSDGFTVFYELGAGRTLAGFLKKTLPQVDCYSLSHVI